MSDRIVKMRLALDAKAKTGDLGGLKTLANMIMDALSAVSKPYGGPDNYEVVIQAFPRSGGMEPVSVHRGTCSECVGYLKAMHEHAERDCAWDGWVCAGEDFIVWPEEHWGKSAKEETQAEWESRKSNR